MSELTAKKPMPPSKRCLRFIRKAQKDPKAPDGQRSESSSPEVHHLNIKSLPGVMTIRGCAYAGSKGRGVGSDQGDMIHISHGPVGCGQYSRAGRRNYYVGTTGCDTFGTMNFTSDFQERTSSSAATRSSPR